MLLAIKLSETQKLIVHSTSSSHGIHFNTSSTPGYNLYSNVPVCRAIF